jgi:hypothetical protein
MSDNPLDTFAREAQPAPALQRRIEQTLRKRGHLTSRSTPWRSIGLAASLLIAAGLGFAAGRVRPAVQPHEGRQYLLLLREDSTYRDDRPIGEIVREYGQWADSLRRENLLVSAQKLGDEQESVTASDVPIATESPTTGFFLVRASTLEDARAIAAASPHVKYGGRIVVRSVE